MKTHNQTTNELHFIILEEHEMYVAVCLERWIGAQGKSINETQTNLCAVYRAELDYSSENNLVPFVDLPKAPEKFHEMFENGEGVVQYGTILDKNSLAEVEQKLAA